MANFIPYFNQFGANSIEAFVSTDPYIFSVDNRPLFKLLDNDLALDSSLFTVEQEVVNARDGEANLLAKINSIDAAVLAAQNDATAALSGANPNIPFAIAAANNVRQIPHLQGLNGFLGFCDNRPEHTNNLGSLGAGNSPHIRGYGPYTEDNPTNFMNKLTASFSIASDTSNLGKYLYISTDNGSSGASGPQPDFLIDTSALNGEINLPAPPSSGYRVDVVVIEAYLIRIDANELGLTTSDPLRSFKRYGAADNTQTVGSYTNGNTIDPQDPALMGTVSIAGDGIYTQKRWKWSTYTYNVNTSAGRYGIIGEAGRAYNGTPTAYTLVTAGGTTAIEDNFYLHTAGDGSNASKAALGTVDGYVYVVPFALVYRRNTSNFDPTTNPNGCGPNATSVTMNGVKSGHPLGLRADLVYAWDIVDLRQVIAPNIDIEDVQRRTFNAFVNGNLCTGFRMGDGFGQDATAMFPDSGIYHQSIGSVAGNFRQIGDVPNGIRRIWSSTPYTQSTSGQLVSGADASFAGGLFSLEHSTRILTFNALANGNPAGTVTNTLAPVMRWSGDGALVVLSVAWATLGTSVATATIDSVDYTAHSGQTIQINARLDFAGLVAEKPYTWTHGLNNQSIRTAAGAMFGLVDGTNAPVVTPFTGNSSAQGLELVKLSATDAVGISGAITAYYHGASLEFQSGRYNGTMFLFNYLNGTTFGVRVTGTLDGSGKLKFRLAAATGLKPVFCLDYSVTSGVASNTTVLQNTVISTTISAEDTIEIDFGVANAGLVVLATVACTGMYMCAMDTLRGNIGNFLTWKKFTLTSNGSASQRFWLPSVDATMLGNTQVAHTATDYLNFYTPTSSVSPTPYGNAIFNTSGVNISAVNAFTTNTTEQAWLDISFVTPPSAATQFVVYLPVTWTPSASTKIRFYNLYWNNAEMPYRLYTNDASAVDVGIQPLTSSRRGLFFSIAGPAGNWQWHTWSSSATHVRTASLHGNFPARFEKTNHTALFDLATTPTLPNLNGDIVASVLGTSVPSTKHVMYLGEHEFEINSGTLISGVEFNEYLPTSGVFVSLQNFRFGRATSGANKYGINIRALSGAVNHYLGQMGTVKLNGTTGLPMVFTWITSQTSATPIISPTSFANGYACNFAMPVCLYKGINNVNRFENPSNQ